MRISSQTLPFICVSQILFALKRQLLWPLINSPLRVSYLHQILCGQAGTRGSFLQLRQELSSKYQKRKSTEVGGCKASGEDKKTRPDPTKQAGFNTMQLLKRIYNVPKFRFGINIIFRCKSRNQDLNYCHPGTTMGEKKYSIAFCIRKLGNFGIFLGDI